MPKFLLFDGLYGWDYFDNTHNSALQKWRNSATTIIYNIGCARLSDGYICLYYYDQGQNKYFVRTVTVSGQVINYGTASQVTFNTSRDNGIIGIDSTRVLAVGYTNQLCVFVASGMTWTQGSPVTITNAAGICGASMLDASTGLVYYTKTGALNARFVRSFTVSGSTITLANNETQIVEGGPLSTTFLNDKISTLNNSSAVITYFTNYNFNRSRARIVSLNAGVITVHSSVDLANDVTERMYGRLVYHDPVHQYAVMFVSKFVGGVASQDAIILNVTSPTLTVYSTTALGNIGTVAADAVDPRPCVIDANHIMISTGTADRYQLVKININLVEKIGPFTGVLGSQGTGYVGSSPTWALADANRIVPFGELRYTPPTPDTYEYGAYVLWNGVS